MKRILTRIGALAAAFVLAVSMCSAVSVQAATSKSSSKATYDDAGYYVLAKMIEEGEEYDMAVLKAFGMYGGLVLDDDTTGFIFFGSDEITDITWKDGSISADGETIKYTFDKKGFLVLEQEGVALYFEKSYDPAPTREDVMAGQVGTGESEGNEGIVKQDIAVVGGTYELFDAIADNQKILLMPGTYNITEYIEANEKDIEYWDWEDEEFFGYGVFQDEVYDGKQLIIGNVDNLTIMSADPDDPAEIVVEPKYAHVLTFYDCDNLEIDDIVIGHDTEPGTCRGNVFDLICCDNVQMSNVDGYGCGVIALSASSCDNIRLNHCNFHDCSQGIISAENTSNLVANYCKFSNVDSWGIISAYNSEIDLVSCTFKKLSGGLISAYSESDVNLLFPKFDKTSQAAFDNSFDGETADCITIVTEDDIPKG